MDANVTFVSTQDWIYKFLTFDIIVKVDQRDNKKSGLELRLYLSGICIYHSEHLAIHTHYYHVLSVLPCDLVIRVRVSFFYPRVTRVIH